MTTLFRDIREAKAFQAEFEILTIEPEPRVVPQFGAL